MEALLFQTPDQVRPLVYRLALHHGVIEQPKPSAGATREARGILKYQPVLPDGPGGVIAERLHIPMRLHGWFCGECCPV